MKVAILIIGHLRTWSDCKDNFLKSFYHLNPDVFVSTYDLQYNYHPAQYQWMGGMPDMYLRFDEINSLFDNINLINLDVEKISDVLNESNKIFLHPNFQNEAHTFFQYRKINKAIQCVIDYEDEMKLKYDIIIKIRPDIYHKKFEYSISNTNVIVSTGNVFPNDVLIAANRNNFIKIFEFINSEIYNQTYVDSHLKPPHNLLKCACNHNGLTIDSFDLMDYVLRRAGRHYYN